jgi:sulfur transfer complex TusBCD TusB component (DsrH family)
MSAIDLNVDKLELDLDNPRIVKAASQHEATQRIIREQGVKIANLADDISARGLNPGDR